jgi:hypothetical protein
MKGQLAMKNRGYSAHCAYKISIKALIDRAIRWNISAYQYAMFMFYTNACKKFSYIVDGVKRTIFQIRNRNQHN